MSGFPLFHCSNWSGWLSRDQSAQCYPSQTYHVVHWAVQINGSHCTGYYLCLTFGCILAFSVSQTAENSHQCGFKQNLITLTGKKQNANDFCIYVSACHEHRLTFVASVTSAAVPVWQRAARCQRPD